MANWSIGLEVSASGETSDLAVAVNSMANSLRNIIHDLAAERDKMAAVLDTMGDGVVVVGAQGRMELVNPAAVQLLSLRPEDVGRRDYAEVLRDPDLREIFTRCQRSGLRQTSEMDLNQAGHLIPVNIIATAAPGQHAAGCVADHPRSSHAAAIGVVAPRVREQRLP